jgi:hypothetical protein
VPENYSSLAVDDTDILVHGFLGWYLSERPRKREDYIVISGILHEYLDERLATGHTVYKVRRIEGGEKTRGATLADPVCDP